MDRKEQLRKQAAERSRQRRQTGRTPTAHQVSKPLPSNGSSGNVEATFKVTGSSWGSWFGPSGQGPHPA